MYVWNLNPVIFSVGPFSVRWYGLVYAIGFLLAYWLLIRASREGRIELTEKDVDEFITFFVIGIIFFARLFYVAIYNPQYYASHLLESLAIWKGGLSFHGGFLGAIIVGLWYSKKKNISFMSLADMLVVPLALMLAFGRLANFINGELPGRIASPKTPWCVIFPHFDGECRHPSQIYEMIKNLMLFATLLWLRAKEFGEGILFWSFIALYGAGRFITDFWRLPDPTDWLVKITGLAIGQWLNIIMIIIGLSAIITLKKRRNNRSG